ncbi:MAG: thrombospondin type 3 repeat-containing protein [Pseudomonadota bacterium]
MKSSTEHKLATRFAAFTALLFSMSLANAEITGGTLTGGESFDNGGIFQLIAAPPELGNNAFDDDNVRAFDEMQNLLLLENLILDVTEPTVTSNLIAAGSVVSSHYILYDPGSSIDVVGSVTFDEPVLGVILSNGRFNDTDDVLGSVDTTYSIGSQGLESVDEVIVSGNTVSFSLRANSPGDALRVVTGVNPQFAINVCEGSDLTLTAQITGGDALARGGRFRQICDPIGPVGDNNFDSFDLFAFEEQQAVELDAPLVLNSSDTISPGEVVSSYYVIWDPISSNTVEATITFPDTIIGVIADRENLQASEFLGDASATYLNPNSLGLEGSDTFSIDGANLMIDFSAGTPGDSVRVLLGSASVNLGGTPCEPSDVTVSGSVTGGSAASNGGTFVQLCDPIGPVGNDNFQANDLFAFEERSEVTLAEDLLLDDPAGTSIPAGTVVSSYYVAFDPGATRTIVGTITFPDTILGLATSTELMNASDGVGNPTAVYLNPSLRGLEPEDDSASFSGETLLVELEAGSPGDYIRVIVGSVDTDPETDTDDDGVPDSSDNCTTVPNPDQIDADKDGFGNFCDADLNNDCIVNVADLGVLRMRFFSDDPIADFNSDGAVNAGDLGIIRSAFFEVPGPSAFGSACD